MRVETLQQLSGESGDTPRISALTAGTNDGGNLAIMVLDSQPELAEQSLVSHLPSSD